MLAAVWPRPRHGRRSEPRESVAEMCRTCFVDLTRRKSLKLRDLCREGIWAVAACKLSCAVWGWWIARSQIPGSRKCRSFTFTLCARELGDCSDQCHRQLLPLIELFLAPLIEVAPACTSTSAAMAPGLPYTLSQDACRPPQDLCMHARCRAAVRPLLQVLVCR